jgi:hypothetical protein
MSSAIKQFGIDLPDGWEDQTVYTFKGPDDSGVQHNLVLIIDNQLESTDLLTYAKMRIEALKTTLDGFELMGERQKELKSGHKAYEVVYKWIPVENKTLVQKQVYIIIDNIGYNFTASFSKKTIKIIGNQVDEIINKFNPVAETPAE